MAAAVAALIRDGNQETADALLANVAASQGTEAADQLRATATEQIADTTARLESTKYDDGALHNSKDWYLYSLRSYGYCTISGGSTNCQHVGSTAFDLWHNLYDYGTPGYGVSLAGTTAVQSGNPIIFTKYTCKTFYEVWPLDQHLRDWANCSGAVDPNPFTVRMIPYEGWLQGSAQGTRYHLEITVNFKVSGDANGATFSHVWNSNSYKITTNSSADFLS